MNDFTKDELEEIQEIARHCCKQAVETRHNLTYTVKLKAERMIDNYCDHENSVVPLYILNGDLPASGLCHLCFKAVDRDMIK